jgi:2-dehydro-3-deoxy-phosphogluconate aldolase
MNEKLYGKFLFNFLAHNRQNAEAVVEAGKGYVVPGITADKFNTVEEAAAKVNELKQVTDVVSIGLGGGGNTANWKKVLEIAVASNPGHINQPFETATYSKGYLDAKGTPKQLVNALIQPTGEVGTIKLANSGAILRVEEFIEVAAGLGIESIKMMPVKGAQHLDELIYVTKVASEKGIRGVEPAGGISASNIKEIILGVKDIDIEFFMPHIFGTTIDSETGETIPEKVKEILDAVEGL